MSMTDPIGDLLTRIRNANKERFESVTIPHSIFKEEIVRVLKEEGYVRGYETVGEGIVKSLVITLKYTQKKERIIEGLVRVSKPGHRRFLGYTDIKPIRGGLGMAILSTPKGVLSDKSAKHQKLGGEWVCSVW
ncbi:MAG: 30S ribosomal protein S8 [Deltaproteobacteria bacterium]|nr:30S ribosomal protein S8 [Deltaproteobacteria bacterium]MBI2342654.1 30S ribosomal protein S8 [Deltaproteobacteria bacterium]MBI2975183.1 30S ribosomal protein S8 [Deltaproteobacteria bacterium]